MRGRNQNLTDALWRTSQLEAAKVQQIVSRFNVSERVARWLCLRVGDEEDIRQFLNVEDIRESPPDAFVDMDAAVNRILRAVAGKERICIVGDYDVDGVTASAILATTLNHLGADWECLIPHRVNEGYGLSVSLVERAMAIDCKLIVTVDNGIRSIEAIDFGQAADIDFVITDHHEPGDVLPDPNIPVVHWSRSTTDGVKVLSGAGVAWKMAIALLAVVGVESVPLQDWHRGLATLGALADVMPMIGENRRLVKMGLKALKRCQLPGWQALCDVARVSIDNLTEGTVLWNLTPRLNAAGRMDTAETAFNLLMAVDANTAKVLAESIEANNQARKLETERTFLAAAAQFEQYQTHTEAAAIVVSGPWNLGIVGIVAAKLVEKFQRPAIVFADDGSGLFRGSGRAPQGFPLLSVVEQCADVLDHFGGHEAALGCAVAEGQFAGLQRRLNHAVGELGFIQGGEVVELADDYLPLSEATLDNARWIEQFAPYGPDNPALKFYVGPVELLQVSPMGNGKHARLSIREGQNKAQLVWFQVPAEVFAWPSGSIVSAIVDMSVNVWQGAARVQLQVQEAYLLNQPLLRDEFGEVYRLLHARRKVTAGDVASILPRAKRGEAEVVLAAFGELGFAHYRENAYHVVEHVVPKDLRDSLSYQSHLRRVTQS
jgi:single-stranded-DNA-specific exonuclease